MTKLCEKCMTPSRCLAGRCARETLERDKWLADNSEKIAEVLVYADNRVAEIKPYEPWQREKARVAAIREILGRFREMVAEEVRMAPVQVAWSFPDDPKCAWIAVGERAKAAVLRGEDIYANMLNFGDAMSGRVDEIEPRGISKHPALGMPYGGVELNHCTTCDRDTPRDFCPVCGNGFVEDRQAEPPPFDPVMIDIMEKIRAGSMTFAEGLKVWDEREYKLAGGLHPEYRNRRFFVVPKQANGSCSVCAKFTCDGECCQGDPGVAEPPFGQNPATILREILEQGGEITPEAESALASWEAYLNEPVPFTSRPFALRASEQLRDTKTLGRRVPCPLCHGSGKKGVFNRTCRRCNGTKEVPL